MDRWDRTFAAHPLGTRAMPPPGKGLDPQSHCSISPPVRTPVQTENAKDTDDGCVVASVYGCKGIWVFECMSVWCLFDVLGVYGCIDCCFSVVLTIDNTPLTIPHPPDPSSPRTLLIPLTLPHLPHPSSPFLNPEPQTIVHRHSTQQHEESPPLGVDRYRKHTQAVYGCLGICVYGCICVCMYVCMCV